jgi:hypothetical protein
MMCIFKEREARESFHRENEEDYINSFELVILNYSRIQTGHSLRWTHTPCPEER